MPISAGTSAPASTGRVPGWAKMTRDIPTCTGVDGLPTRPPQACVTRSVTS